MALSSKNFRIADILLRKGANINAVNKFSQNGILANLNNSDLVKYIHRTIENNYQVSVLLVEDFDIMGSNNQNNNIKNKIKALYEKCQKI